VALAPGLRNVSKCLIDRFGTSVTVTTVAEGSYNTATRTVTNTETATTLKGVWEEFTDREIDGTAIQVGDRKLIVPAKDLATKPDASAKVTIGTLVMKVIRVEDFMVEGSAAAYRLHLRGAAQV
jgi:hypothetical protein